MTPVGLRSPRTMLEFDAAGGSRRSVATSGFEASRPEPRVISGRADTLGLSVYSKDASAVGYLYTRLPVRSDGIRAGDVLEVAASVSPLPFGAETADTATRLTSAPNDNAVDAHRSTEDADVLWVLDQDVNRIYAYRISTGELLP